MVKHNRSMKLHALGTAGYHPGEHRQTSCYFLPESGIMFDAGTGIFRSTALIQTEELHIFLSHAHLDHTFGLTFLLDIVYRTKLKKVFVYAEAEKIEAIQNGLLHPLMFPVSLPIDWIALESLTSPLMISPKPIQNTGNKSGKNTGKKSGKTPAEASVQWFSLEHPGGSVGYRIDWPDVSLAYVTDTTAKKKSAYWKVVNKVDWLIHECNFRDSETEFAKKTGHSWTSAVLEGAKHAKIKHLILTHFLPTSNTSDPIDLAAVLATHRDLGPSEVIVAEDRLIVELLESDTETKQ